MAVALIPREFIWRRLHSLMGLWLVLFLIEHLLTNSQAALWLGSDGSGFIKMVNSLHDLPYLQAIEMTLLGIPILIHLVWGVKYALTSKGNAHKTKGSKPSLPSYGRNKAYSWQRITSWILLAGLVTHVVQFRFLEYPEKVAQGDTTSYFVKLQMDDGLYTLAYRLHIDLYDSKAVEKELKNFDQRSDEKTLLEAASVLKNETKDYWQGVAPVSFDGQKEIILQSAQKYKLKAAWIEALKKWDLKEGQVIAESHSFGTATLLTVRDTFKSPIYIALYTVFVVAACFHAFNGFWTFLLTWGILVKRASQKSMITVAISLMVILTFLGLASVWGTFWFNLRN